MDIFFQRAHTTMYEIQVNVDDDFLHSDLQSTYGYKKAKVNFNGMSKLYKCLHLEANIFMRPPNNLLL